MLTGIFMASGLSQRMGQNKLLMTIGDTPIYEKTINAILQSNIENLIVVTCYDQIIKFCEKKNIPYIKNSTPEVGQSQSIKLGVSHCDKNSDFMFFVADQPFLKPVTINKLIVAYEKEKNAIIIPKNKNTYGNPKIFPKSLRKEFLSLTGDVRGSWITKNHPELLKFIEIPDDLSLEDIDTMEDYIRLN